MITYKGFYITYYSFEYIALRSASDPYWKAVASDKKLDVLKLKLDAMA